MEHEETYQKEIDSIIDEDNAYYDGSCLYCDLGFCDGEDSPDCANYKGYK